MDLLEARDRISELESQVHALMTTLAQLTQLAKSQAKLLEQIELELKEAPTK